MDNSILTLAYTAIFVYLGTKIIIWLFKYVSLAKSINKIKTPYTMLPFIGNAHQLKPGSGDISIQSFFVLILFYFKYE